jgi:ACS family allantoate permease-like MFS transporter
MSDAIARQHTNEVEIASQKGDNDLVVAYQIDRADEKAVVRKLDRVILPLMALIYFFQCESLGRCALPDTF